MNSVTQGSLLIAILISFSAGLISFLSPCVLPLVPGYLSFITGFGLNANKSIRKSKALIATLLFIEDLLSYLFALECFLGELVDGLFLTEELLKELWGYLSLH
jgi:cytochrome c-type biogenesis protein